MVKQDYTLPRHECRKIGRKLMAGAELRIMEHEVFRGAYGVWQWRRKAAKVLIALAALVLRCEVKIDSPGVEQAGSGRIPPEMHPCEEG